MSCKYKEECPSYSGWCELPKQDFSRCVSFLVTAYENVKEELSLCKIQLQGYKDTGLTPEQMLEIDREYAVLAKEVAELRKND